MCVCVLCVCVLLPEHIYWGKTFKHNPIVAFTSHFKPSVSNRANSCDSSNTSVGLNYPSQARQGHVMHDKYTDAAQDTFPPCVYSKYPLIPVCSIKTQSGFKWRVRTLVVWGESGCTVNVLKYVNVTLGTILHDTSRCVCLLKCSLCGVLVTKVTAVFTMGMCRMPAEMPEFGLE